MKKSILVLSILIIGYFLVTIITGGGPVGDSWQTNIAWADPQTSADDIRGADKPLYIFVTTEWCTYCKKMKGETFTDAKVQKALNNNFVSVVIDPEKKGTTSILGREMTYAEAARELGVRGYPANFFYTPQGDLIGGQPGYIGADQFASLAGYIGEGHYRKMTFTEYLAGPGAG